MHMHAQVSHQVQVPCKHADVSMSRSRKTHTIRQQGSCRHRAKLPLHSHSVRMVCLLMLRRHQAPPCKIHSPRGQHNPDA